MPSVGPPGPYFEVSEYYDEYSGAVYSNLFIGIVYGEAQETSRSRPILSHCTTQMITGAYIVIYITSVYVLL
jgi:hypothetical protein